MIIGVTGANGFVGRAVLSRLHSEGHVTVPLVRASSGLANEFIIGNIEVAANLRLPPLDAIVHLAALTHDDNRKEFGSRNKIYDINVIGTQNIVEAAIKVGVKKVVFVSSAKVNGEFTEQDAPFSELDIPNPRDDYAKSKLDAEKVILCLVKKSKDVSYTILRPPLVYGAGVTGNFKKLVSLSKSRIPLPLGEIPNKRSLVSVKNLADSINHIIKCEKAKNQILMVSDGTDFSTSQLLDILAKAQGRKICFLPSGPLRFILYLLRLHGLENRIFRNLQIDSRRLRLELGWSPPHHTESEIIDTLHE